MAATRRTKAQLLEELAFLREKVAQLEAEVSTVHSTDHVMAENEDRFRSVVEHSHDGIVIVNDEFKIVYANNHICQMTGYCYEEIVGSPPTLIMAEDAKQLITDRYHRRMKGEDVPSRYQFDLQRKDGQTINVELSATVFVDKSGRRFNVSQFLDLTEQRKAQAALSESEERYRLITDNSLTGVYIIRGDKFLYVNPRFAEILGSEAGDIVGSDFWRHVHPNDREMVKARGLARQRGEKDIPSRYEYRALRADGDYAWVEILATTITLGGALANMGNVVDITKRKKAEIELLESEYRFRCLQEASFGGIAIHEDGLILDANQALSDMTGFSEDELIGMDGLNIIAPRWRDEVRAKIRSAYGQTYESEGLRKDGTVYPLEIRGKTMPYKGRIARVTEFRDITERVMTETALQKSEQRFATALEASPQCMAITTKAEGRLLEINEAFSVVSGYSRDQIIGQTSLEIGLWHDSTDRLTSVQRLDKQGRIRGAEMLWRLKNGRTINMLWSADIIDWAGQECLINSFTNITEFKKAQESLRSSEEKHRSAMEASYEPMVVYDIDGKAQYINPAFTRVFGWTTDELIGERIDFVPEEEKEITSREITCTIYDGYKSNFETKRLTKDGRVLDVGISAASFKGIDNAVRGMVVNLRDITQQKKQEREIKLSEARLKHMVELAGDWFWEMDSDLRFSEVSPKFLDMTGICKEEIIGKTSWDFIAQDKLLCEPASWKAHVNNLRAHRPFNRFEYGLITPSQKSFYMSISGVPLFNQQGQFTGYRGSGSEITDRVQANQALQSAHDDLEKKVKERTAELAESRRNFMQAFHESPAWMCITDMDTGRFVEVNDAYSHGLGRTREELIGKTTLEAGIWPDQDARKKWLGLVQPGVDSGSPGAIEVELQHKDGSTRMVTGSVGVMQWDDKQVFLSTAIDVTEQMEVQAALRESEQRYRTVLDNTGTAIAIVDENTIITFANREFEHLSGYSSEEYLNTIKWTEFVHHDDVAMMRDFAWRRRAEGQDAPKKYEFRFVTRSGDIRNVLLVTEMLPGTNSNVSSMMDITELKQTQEELRRHRDRLEDIVADRTLELRTALSEKEVLLREIHHRVKNNMAVVSSLLNLQANKVNDVQVQMALQESQNRVRTMALIHETLYRSDSLAEVDLQSYIGGLVANLTGIFEPQPGRVNFVVDAGGVKLEVNKAVPCGLIINELVTNTLKYAFPQSTQGDVHIVARRRNGDEIELVLSDSGIGFPPELDIHTAKSLGLRLIGLMVEQLHGHWKVENCDGAKTIIRWPLNG